MKLIKFKNKHKFVAYDGKDKYTFLEIRLYNDEGVQAKGLNYHNFEKFVEEVIDKPFVVGEPDFSTRNVYLAKGRNKFGRKVNVLYYPCHEAKEEYVKTQLGDLGIQYYPDLENFHFIKPIVSLTDTLKELETATDEEAAQIGVSLARALRTLKDISAKPIKLQKLSLKDDTSMEL